MISEPDRVAFAGDWHGNAEWAERAIEYAKSREANVVVHLGDFGYTFTSAFLRRLSEALIWANLQILFVDGNHEHHPKLLRYPVAENGLRMLTDTIWHLPRGFRWSWSGVRFLALGGAHSVDRPFRVPGISWWPEEAITAEQAAFAATGGEVDVLVSHDCPAGVEIPGLEAGADLFPPLEIMRANEHRQVLRSVVNAVMPRWIWHGHYHPHAHRTVADLGYGPVTVTGLDCDGTSMDRNIQVVNLHELGREQIDSETG